MLAQEPGLEVLVIDSGSRDGSPAIARAAGAERARDRARRVRARAHAQPRRRAHERRADLLPHPGRDAAAGLARGLPRGVRARRARRRGVRPAPAAAGHVADDRARADRVLRRLLARRRARRCSARATSRSSPTSTPATGARAGRQIRFERRRRTPRTRRSAARMLAAGWAKAYHPGAAVLHAHDYPPVGFMRRYFDEYRGLRETLGPRRARSACARRRATSARLVGRRPRAGCASRASRRATRARWTGALARCTTAGRKVFSALGSRARPAAGAGRSGRSRSRARAVAAPRRRRRRRPPPCTAPRAARRLRRRHARRARRRRRRCSTPCRGWRTRERLHVAVVIPHFRRGSGGHSTIFNLLTRLEERGHTVIDLAARPDRATSGRVAGGRRAATCASSSAPIQGPVFKGFDELVRRRRRRSRRAGTPSTRCCGSTSAARAPTSCRTTSPSSSPPRPRRCGREQTYTHGLYCITGEPVAARPARDALRRATPAASTSASTTTSTARAPVARRRRHDHLLRPPRHAAARRPARACRRSPSCTAAARTLRFVLFGDTEPIDPPFPHEHLGVASPEELSWAYSEATVGLSLSLTNYSLIPQEMMACGLPCVELAGDNLERVFGADGPARARAADPVELADALERAARRPGAARAPRAAGPRVRRRPDLGPRRRPARGGPARRAARRASSARRGAPRAGAPRGAPRRPARGAPTRARARRAARRHAGDRAPVRAARRRGRRGGRERLDADSSA